MTYSFVTYLFILSIGDAKAVIVYSGVDCTVVLKCIKSSSKVRMIHMRLTNRPKIHSVGKLVLLGNFSHQVEKHKLWVLQKLITS